MIPVENEEYPAFTRYLVERYSGHEVYVLPSSDAEVDTDEWLVTMFDDDMGGHEVKSGSSGRGGG